MFLVYFEIVLFCKYMQYRTQLVAYNMEIYRATRRRQALENAIFIVKEEVIPDIGEIILEYPHAFFMEENLIQNENIKFL